MQLKYIIPFIAPLVLLSCSKDDSKKEFGFSKIYMPQAIFKSGGVNNDYPVPAGVDSSTYNYSIDTKEKTIDIVLGAALSGPGDGAFSVDIKVNNDTVQQLLDRKVLDPAKYQLMPAAMYSLPTKLEVEQGSRTGHFALSVDINQLKSTGYTGKILLLAVKLENPSRYELNNAVSTTMVVLDVDAMVIGPAVNITGKYLLNAGNPFVASAMNGTRWGNLKDWSANTAAKSHGGYGGFSADAGGTMNMECGWGSPQILNGKIWQTTTLPAGTYTFDPTPWNWQGTKEPAYVVVAPNLDTVPDYSNIAGNTAIWYKNFTDAKVTFELTAATKVTFGFVVNYIQTEQGFKTTAVKLYNYPKHL